MQHNLTVALPDALREVLGRGIAAAREEWNREARYLAADQQRQIAEATAQIHAKIADVRMLEMDLQRRMDDFHRWRDDQERRIETRLSELRDGEPGPQGPGGERGPEGPAGKDADPEHVKRLVDEAAAQLPDFVRRSVADAVAEIPVIAGERGEPGPPGRDADPALMERMVAGAVEKAVAEIPKPKDGEPGPQGEPGPLGPEGPTGPPGPQGERGEPGVEGARGEKGEKGEQGETGEKGLQGERGEPGLEGARGEKGEPGLQGERGDRGEPGPRGEKGDIGEKGERGDLGPQGERGLSGVDGLPGRDGRDGLVGEKGERGPQGPVGPIGERGEKGQIGEPGLGFTDFEAEWKGDRELSLKWARGEHVHDVKKHFPVPLYREVFKEGTKYQRGDAITFGGSIWIALRDTEEKPGLGDAWRMAVRAGRDRVDGTK